MSGLELGYGPKCCFLRFDTVFQSEEGVDVVVKTSIKCQYFLLS